ncbi:MAG: restriction endonuclease subunit R [Verrucomicrobia bacterium Tous-C9LFEB]|nr:MAG: restriction endonuclease subunit R [Verrucomicrobia bacterium Tous-C9LFEB]
MPTDTGNTPEGHARQKIDELLVSSGWIIQDYKTLNLGAGQGIAIREVPLKEGRCDYLLLVDRKPVGVVEAKKVGTTLSAVAEQSGQYAANLPDFLKQADLDKLPFLYESTGVETYFRDERDPAPRSRRVFSFHRPETLAEWFTHKSTLRWLLGEMPFAHPLVTNGMRDCQIEAITNLEKSFAEAKPRALIQMATGAGKTFTACAFTYRLIKYAGARRVLFLVDRSNLGRQAKSEFDQFITPDTGRKFTELYNIQHLSSNQLDSVAKVTICTIQRLYSILRGESELDEDIDEKSGFELAAADSRPKDVAYNPSIPIEAFDFVITDECHRSIYNLWRQVLEYFDAFLIGLTATPSKQTIGFFNQNLVTEYNHERAVADGVNVGYDVYRIRTQVTEQGSKVEKGFYVDRRNKETRQLRWERLDEDFVYTNKEVDRSVVVPDQIRTVIETFRSALPELFPNRTLIPKTLIFAKDDSHAEDIVHLCREVFGKGNDFCKKITYKAYNADTKRYEKSESLIQEFRTSPQLRIAVTVDMIATGTDIKPLECLLFLRDVRSRVYFEQMKGRGTRVLTPTDLQAVSGADAHAKTHFVIVDAVGVCESDKSDSRPLERKPTVSMPNLLLGIALGKRDEDAITTLAGRLARLDRAIDTQQRKEITDVAGGKTPAELSAALLRALDPDVIAEQATGKPGASQSEVAPELFEQTKKKLVDAACLPFDQPVLRDLIAKVKQETEQTIDNVTADTVISSGFDAAAKDKAAGLLRSFKEYIEQHHAEIAALQILYSRPYAQRLTEPMLKELEKKLRDNHATWTEDRLWDAYVATNPDRVKGRTQTGRFADLVSLVRFSLEQQPVLKPFAESVQERFNGWLMDKAKAGTTFSADQQAWLELVRDHIATSLSIEPDDFDYAPFSQRGGLGKAHQLFGDQLPQLLEELNETLAA